MARTIFISHTKADKALADAWQASCEEVFRDKVEVHYSSRDDGEEGAIRPGENWFSWIANEVVAADATLLLLTPMSVQKPWLMWEAGAVYGVAAAKPGGTARVFPVLYNLSSAEAPSPLVAQNPQFTYGENPKNVQNLMFEIAAFPEIVDLFPGAAGAKLGARIKDALPGHINAVREALKMVPMMPTEAACAEWIDRLHALRDGNRLSELPQVHRWLEVAFGRGPKEKGLPIDLRLHRLLGDLHQRAKSYGVAASQFELALKVAPRDMYLLRRLGQAALDQFEKGGGADPAARDLAAQALDRMSKIDADALLADADCAALRARLLEAQGLREKADEHLAKAVERSPDSTYLAERHAQLLLRMGRKDDGIAAYARIAKRIAEAPSSNDVWRLASLAGARLATGQMEGALAVLQQLSTLAAPEAKTSILRGFGGLRADGLIDDEQLARCRAALEQAPR